MTCLIVVAIGSILSLTILAVGITGVGIVSIIKDKGKSRYCSHCGKEARKGKYF